MTNLSIAIIQIANLNAKNMLLISAYYRCAKNTYLEYLVNLINLRSSWKQRLHCQQFCEYASHRPQVDRSGVFLWRDVNVGMILLYHYLVCEAETTSPQEYVVPGKRCKEFCIKTSDVRTVFINIPFHKQN